MKENFNYKCLKFARIVADGSAGPQACTTNGAVGGHNPAGLCHTCACPTFPAKGHSSASTKTGAQVMEKSVITLK